MAYRGSIKAFNSALIEAPAAVKTAAMADSFDI